MGRGFSSIEIEGNVDSWYQLERVYAPDDEFAVPQVLGRVAGRLPAAWLPKDVSYTHPILFESLHEAETALEIYRLGQENVYARPVD